jgi:hypothetical protein
MKAKHLLVVALGAVVGMALCAIAYAAETVPPARKAVPVVKADVEGKVTVKTVKVAGKEQKEVSIVVSEAKGTDGKPLPELTGKSLRVLGTKVADVEKLADKQVIATGTLERKNKAIGVTAVTEKPAPPAPSAPAEPAAPAPSAPAEPAK